MSEGFGGFVDKDKPKGDGKARVIIDDDAVAKLLKDYKRLKKYQKSPLYEVNRISGKETEIERLINKYAQEDSEPE